MEVRGSALRALRLEAKTQRTEDRRQQAEGSWKIWSAAKCREHRVRKHAHVAPSLSERPAPAPPVAT